MSRSGGSRIRPPTQPFPRIALRSDRRRFLSAAALSVSGLALSACRSGQTSPNAFATPTDFLRDDVLRYIEVEGALRRINQQQNSHPASLFGDHRMERLIEFEGLTVNKRDAYPLGEMLTDVRRGIRSQLSAGSLRSDAFRRELQRSCLTQVNNKVSPPPFTPPAGLPAGFAAQIGPARATSGVRSLSGRSSAPWTLLCHVPSAAPGIARHAPT